MEVEMKIRGLMMDPVTNMPIVVLKDPSSDAVLPIWVGIYEANAIALEIERISEGQRFTTKLLSEQAQQKKNAVHELSNHTST